MGTEIRNNAGCPSGLGAALIPQFTWVQIPPQQLFMNGVVAM